MMEQFGYKVVIDQYCNEDWHDGEEWGQWHSSYTNSLNSVSTANEYPDVVSIHDLKPGDRAYLVWVEWSSGDSFGHGDRTSVEAIGLFVDEDSAKGLAACIEDTNSYTNYQTSTKVGYKVTTSDGQEFENLYAPWCGYFESLDSVNVETVVIE